MATKAPKTAWRKGQSGNPAGKAAGTGKVQALRASIEQHIPSIISGLVAKATLEGDVGAARLLLERVLPPVKATEQATPLQLPSGSLTDQGRAVLTAVAAGELSPTQGAQLVTAIGSLARLVELDELTNRITALEAAHHEKTH
jgi:hypothetical protein